MGREAFDGALDGAETTAAISCYVCMVSKDRAAPFSRKHRRYWIPVLGGMIFIGLINLVIGLFSYSNVPPIGDQRIELILPPPTVGPNAHVDAGLVPADVER